MRRFVKDRVFHEVLLKYFGRDKLYIQQELMKLCKAVNFRRLKFTVLSTYLHKLTVVRNV